MQLELPDDILLLICEQVRYLPDTSAGTLFNIALTGKRAAPLALANLYRHATSPGDDEELDHSQMKDLDSVVMKWAIMWRSIYLACDGKLLTFIWTCCGRPGTREDRILTQVRAIATSQTYHGKRKKFTDVLATQVGQCSLTPPTCGS